VHGGGLAVHRDVSDDHRDMPQRLIDVLPAPTFRKRFVLPLWPVLLVGIMANLLTLFIGLGGGLHSITDLWALLASLVLFAGIGVLVLRWSLGYRRGFLASLLWLPIHGRCDVRSASAALVLGVAIPGLVLVAKGLL
jgi:hypothetical protein